MACPVNTNTAVVTLGLLALAALLYTTGEMLGRILADDEVPRRPGSSSQLATGESPHHIASASAVL